LKLARVISRFSLFQLDLSSHMISVLAAVKNFYPFVHICGHGGV